jgi:hypothetical protein
MRFCIVPTTGRILVPTVLYSCVVDKKPLYSFQGLILVQTLIELANVSPRSIVVHIVHGTAAATINAFRELGVKTVVVAEFPGLPTANKLIQLQSEPLRDCEYAVLCDTDLAFAAPCSSWIAGQRLRAKPVDYARPPLSAWPAILEAAALPAKVPACKATHSEELTYHNNFNGGFYIVPQPILESLREIWPRRYREFYGRTDLLGEYAVHVFQISLGVAMAELGDRGDPLPLEANFPIHLPMPAHYEPSCEPIVIHFHKQLDLSGRLLHFGNKLVDRAIDRINERIERSRLLRQAASNPAFKRALINHMLRRRLSQWRRFASAV